MSEKIQDTLYFKLKKVRLEIRKFGREIIRELDRLFKFIS